ncbi:MAG: hypothetical protein VXY27_05120 [Thermoproteota archaeon]|nr:hypothetical protein [Thermoproteota archaeon]
MITKDISVDGSDYKLTLTDQVLNQVDNLKALYATAAEDPESFEQVSSEISAAINNIAESVSPEVSDGHLDGLIQEVFKAVEDKKSEVEKENWMTKEEINKIYDKCKNQGFSPLS